jgi:hypothetical protein
VDGPTAVGKNAAFVNNTAFASPLVFQDVNMATMAASPAAAAMASLRELARPSELGYNLPAPRNSSR